MKQKAAGSGPLLRVRNVTMRFGGLTAVKSLDMTIPRCSLYGLIGPNGAGKTTVFNVLTGVYGPTEGEIEFDGTHIHRKKPYEITKLGAARTFQNIRLFADMTVLQNVMTAHHLRTRQMLGDAVIGTARHHREERETRDRAMELLKIFNLDRFAEEPATSLPYGSQRRLEIARALATKPKLLLLDEPAAGMNPQESHELMRLIQWLRDEMKLTILLVEHNMKVVMGICETIQVIDYGEEIAIGTAAEIQKHPKVIEAYLGGG
ncbi:MAG TPA: ABC transporter ATP-binding protein [Vicinamibacterales bacterium]|nr:ABC transporter ATP-binding protein [Vicinamibacterales bacterium]